MDNTDKYEEKIHELEKQNYRLLCEIEELENDIKSLVRIFRCTECYEQLLEKRGIKS